MSQPKRKSLAELKASEHVGLPERSVEVCVAGRLNAEFDEIDREIDEALKAPKPTRVGAGSPVTKLNARREKLREQMAEYTVTLRFRAKPNHEWRKWMSDHPPRKDDDLDDNLGFNVDAMTDSLREWLVDINGEAVTDEWWSLVADNAASGDLWRLTNAVLALHRSAVDVPKSLTDWLKNRESDDD